MNVIEAKFLSASRLRQAFIGKKIEDVYVANGKIVLKIEGFNFLTFDTLDLQPEKETITSKIYKRMRPLVRGKSNG